MYSVVVWISLFLSAVFFFQAEDGIRDLVRSRGLGDVYKRQQENPVPSPETVLVDGLPDTGQAPLFPPFVGGVAAVSYTHLTLPTIYSV